MALILREQVLDLCGSSFESVGAEDRRAEASVAIHAALAGSLERGLLRGVHTIVSRRVVLVDASLRVVGRVALVGILDLFAVVENLVDLGALGLELADWERDAVDAVLSVVEHVFISRLLPVVVAVEALPADIDLARVRVVREALLGGLVGAVLLDVLSRGVPAVGASDALRILLADLIRGAKLGASVGKGPAA